MKNTLTVSMVLIMILAFGALAFARIDSDRSYGNYTGLTGVGIKAGGNISKEIGSDARFTVPGTGNTLSPSFKGGFVGGAYATYGLADMWAIQPELLFTMKGEKRNTDISIPGVGTANNFRTQLNYLEVPVLLKLMPMTQSNVHPEVYVGPAVSFLLSAKSKYDIGGSTVSNDIKSNLHSTDFGVAFGAGVGYGLGDGRLSLDARYSLGITKIYKTTPQPNIRNSSLSLMVGYSFM